MTLRPEKDGTVPSEAENSTGLAFRPNEVSKPVSAAATTKKDEEEVDDLEDEVDLEEHERGTSPGSSSHRLVEEFEKGPDNILMKELYEQFGEDTNSPARIAFMRQCDEELKKSLHVSLLKAPDHLDIEDSPGHQEVANLDSSSKTLQIRTRIAQSEDKQGQQVPA